MRNLLRVLVASLALAAAAPAVAQYVFKPAWQVEKEEKERQQELQQSAQLFQRWNNVARVNLGVTFSTRPTTTAATGTATTPPTPAARAPG